MSFKASRFFALQTSLARFEMNIPFIHISIHFSFAASSETAIPIRKNFVRSVIPDAGMPVFAAQSIRPDGSGQTGICKKTSKTACRSAFRQTACPRNAFRRRRVKRVHDLHVVTEYEFSQTMFLGYLIIGLLAGWVASKIVRGRGSGLVVNLAVGLVGGILGGWLVSLIGWIPMGSFGSLLTSIAGAIVLLWLVSLVTRDIKREKFVHTK